MTNLPPGAATIRAQSGDGWIPTDHLLASLIDLTAVGNWQRGGNKRATRPKPFPRPGVHPHQGRHFGTARMSIDEMRAVMERHNRGGGHGHRAR